MWPWLSLWLVGYVCKMASNYKHRPQTLFCAESPAQHPENTRVWASSSVTWVIWCRCSVQSLVQVLKPFAQVNLPYTEFWEPLGLLVVCDCDVRPTLTELYLVGKCCENPPQHTPPPEPPCTTWGLFQIHKQKISSQCAVKTTQEVCGVYSAGANI